MMRQEAKVIDFDAIRLKIASPEVIHEWSYGEVTKPETINYRTQKPEKGGLFAEEIFGPSKDWECYCGKYKKVRYKGIVCEKCGVEVTHSLVRRERMGHIDLSSPVSHIWFLRSIPGKIGLVLDMSVMNLEKVIYFANFIITKVDMEGKLQTIEALKQEYKGKRKMLENEAERQMEQLRAKESSDKELKKALEINEAKMASLEEDYNDTMRELKELEPMRIVSEHVYQTWSLKFGHLFEAGIGAEAVYDLLKAVDLKKTIKQLETELIDAFGAKKDKLVRRVKLLRNLDRNDIRPEWMVMTAIPIIPPDLRPMVSLDGGRFATSDLNDLYRRVINRNNRLKRLQELNAPEVISRNEKRMLQEAVDALIDNSARQSKTVIATTGRKRQLKSLADQLKGKQGRFRQNLLGKRIDYSGRSVIVVGPRLKLSQCGLPKRMALELFKPFVIAQLIKHEFCHNIRSANRFIESGRSEIWDILEEITKKSYVMLNRAPTLHRLSIQAFQPTLIEGKAIQLHPMVCPAFNADFDGDQMAVHVPLTEEAKREAGELMLSSKNLLKPATGAPPAMLNKDIIWGIHYLSRFTDRGDGVVKAFASPSEVRLAYQTGNIKLNEKILCRVEKGEKPVETSQGRILLNSVLPEGLPRISEALDTKKSADLVRLCLEFHGAERAAALLDDFKELGFHYASRSGFSWGMDDLPTIKGKPDLLAEGEKRVEEIEEQYSEGLLTQHERYLQIIKVWTEIKDRITKLAKEQLPREGSVASMIESGARGSWSQLTQMVGIKGLVVNPRGDIIELPIKKGFKEGFDVLEFFISTHGARKGLTDTALRTANAGYLTRRLVDVAQDVVIHSEDCGTDVGMEITAEESKEMGETVAARTVGRTALQNVKHPETGKVIVKAGDIVTEANAREMVKLEIPTVHVRSVLTCKQRKGVCQKCYGYDLGYNKLVRMGTAVGIIAAQSIGEPGTQLTMRTFHTGGVAGSDITQGLPRVEELFEARPPKRKAFMADVAGIAKIQEVERRIIETASGERIVDALSGSKVVRISHTEEAEVKFKAMKGDEVAVKDGEKVAQGQSLINRQDGTKEWAPFGGVVKVVKTAITLVGEANKDTEYVIPPGYVLYVKDGQQVEPGDQLTEGDLDLQELYKYKGREAVQTYLTHETQKIYSSQGQKLNDKHIEVIIKQMFSRVYVKEAGDTELLPGETVERAVFEEENARAKALKKTPAEADELFLGITKVSLSTESFLSAASFQETAKVLINAAVSGKLDRLEGLKENVIIGRLIPAGTGFHKPGEAAISVDQIMSPSLDARS
ncbi:MAG: DNA-directed RNA polymerase subunit beta' [Patescibacteria group bacterium]|jgi:DNA-directed RNA polymerase subunit beta'